MGPVIGESHIYTLPKINQNYKQDRNIPKLKTFQVKKHDRYSRQCIVR